VRDEEFDVAIPAFAWALLAIVGLLVFMVVIVHYMEVLL
jgi:hypothetical protein